MRNLVVEIHKYEKAHNVDPVGGDAGGGDAGDGVMDITRKRR